MDFINYIKNKLFGFKNIEVPSQTLNTLGNAESRKILSKYGVSGDELVKLISRSLLIGTDRRNVYTEIEKSLAHPLMAGAAEIFADTSCTRSTINNSTVWAEAKNREYQYELDKLFDILNIEEVIYDWAWTIAVYGDLFIELNCIPGVGLVSVNDDEHPLDVSRLDYQGRLIGFIKTPQGIVEGGPNKIIEPWKYCHFRLLGAKKRRSLGIQDPTFTEYRTMSLMVPDKRRLSSKYGTSIFNNALVVYKRLKMSEDSLLMSRVARSLIRYIYKVVVDPSANPEAVTQIIDEYIGALKRNRSLDVEGAGDFTSKTDLLTGMEDIILPVWENKEGLSIEKLGGDVDIKWISDIEELRNQLASALRVPLPMLGGYLKESPPSLGEGAMKELDIRFSRQCHRIQRAIINGLTRIAQIHLAFQGKNPNLDLFEIKMAETSSAAEERIRESLDRGVDVVDKIVDLLDKTLGDNYDKLEVLDFLNKKILKLNDFDFKTLVTKVGLPGALTSSLSEKQQISEKKEGKSFPKISNLSYYENSDLKAPVPSLKESINKKGEKVFVAFNEEWNKYKKASLEVKKVSIKNK